MAAPIVSRHGLSKFRCKHPSLPYCFHRWTFCRMIYIKKQISDALQDTSLIGQPLNIKGWVNAVRTHKDVTFLNITDGSTLKPLQVLSTPEKTNSITFGSSVCIEGRLLPSPAEGQLTELKADNVHHLGNCDSSEYPFKVKTRHSTDYTRGFPHLRHRTNFFSALLRVRNTATMAIHNFFQKDGYCLINTPIITSNDAEGAGEVFTVLAPKTCSQNKADETTEILNTEDQCNKQEAEFFGNPAYLSVSGQLHLEAVSSGFAKVYTFGPTFRAENSRGRHHLCEFYMLEAELAFIFSMDDIITVMEKLVKSIGEEILEKSHDDVALFHQHVTPGHRASVEKVLSSEFQRLTYDEAVKILEKQNNQFQFKVSWGCDFQKEHEHYLVSHFNNCPVFITDFPVQLKPFYARLNNDGKTVSAVDLLFPGVGELFGGSLREERYDVLKDQLDKSNLTEDFSWYLDLRRFGSVPHGGFGMGFERYLQAFLGIANIKDTIPYPRWPKNCKM